MSLQHGGGQIAYRTAAAVVADRLRALVLSGEITPGTRLLQEEIANQFSTSTTPVREAFGQLVSEGLLVLDPHRGVAVHQPTQEDLRQIYELRLVLEPMSIQATIANVTADDLATAESLVVAMEAETDVARWVRLNGEFHRTLAEASGQPILSSILEKLRNLSAIYIAASLVELPSRIAAANQEHRELLDACRNKDTTRAQETERRHLEHTFAIGRRTVAYFDGEVVADQTDKRVQT